MSRRTHSIVFDTLEPRRLMSGANGSFISPETMPLRPGTTLVVEGSPWGDSIYIDRFNGQVNAWVNGYLQNSRADSSVSQIVIRGRAGNDYIRVADNVGLSTYQYGDDGDDTLVPARNTPEHVYGGNGNDSVSYEGRWNRLSVSLDDVRNDVEVYYEADANGDNVHSDVENVLGGSGDDTLNAGSNNATLLGNNGNDTLNGGLGNDSLSGGWGDDALVGADGNDTLMAGYGRDSLFGGNGWDDVDYRDRWYSVTVTLNWSADDGEAGENDWVLPDIEAVWGGHANDRIVGSDGDNALFGINGDDTILGLGGNDVLYGWYGNDVLVGGNGVDVLNGEQDNDTLVAVGGSQSDTLNGSAGVDTFWADGESGEITDADYWTEIYTGRLNRIGAFMTYHFSNNSNVAVGRDPDGEDLADPTGGGNYVDFGAQPLFAGGGPVSDDIDQNALGDCYFMATLGSIARTNPDTIRRNIVELGDGSFAVRFMNNGSPVYVRVDGDLPTDGSGRIVFAGLGTGGSLWGAIMEKAYAFFRRNDANYQSIAGGWPDNAYSSLGLSSSAYGQNIFGNWEGGADAVMSHIRNELWSGKSVVVCTPGSPGTLVGNHCYCVESVYWSGSEWRIVLRNPWGWTNGNPYVDLNAAQLAANIDRVDSAYV